MAPPIDGWRDRLVQPSEISTLAQAWRPRWAVVAAWFIGSASSLAAVAFLFALVSMLFRADSWQGVLLVIFGSFTLSGAIVAAPAISFIVRGSRLWFYSAVAAAVAIAAISAWH